MVWFDSLSHLTILIPASTPRIPGHSQSSEHQISGTVRLSTHLVGCIGSKECQLTCTRGGMVIHVARHQAVTVSRVSFGGHTTDCNHAHKRIFEEGADPTRSFGSQAARALETGSILRCQIFESARIITFNTIAMYYVQDATSAQHPRNWESLILFNILTVQVPWVVASLQRLQVSRMIHCSDSRCHVVSKTTVRTRPSENVKNANSLVFSTLIGLILII